MDYKIPLGMVIAHLTEEGGWGDGVAWGGGGVVDLGLGSGLASSRFTATLSTDLDSQNTINMKVVHISLYTFLSLQK